MTTQAAVERPTRTGPGAPRQWSVPVALVLLSAIPLVAGTLRLVQLAGGPEIVPADARFAGSAMPLVLHIVAAATYALVGALQLVPRFRRRHRAWHRRAGAVNLVVAEIVIRRPAARRTRRRTMSTAAAGALP